MNPLPFLKEKLRSAADPTPHALWLCRYPTSSVFRDHYRNVLVQYNNLAKRSMLMQSFCYYNKKVKSEGTVWLPPALTKDARVTDTRCPCSLPPLLQCTTWR